MVHLTVVVRKRRDAPFAELPLGFRVRNRAWAEDGHRDISTGKLLTATVHVVEGHEHNALLLAHEAAHHIRDQGNDEMHHPWWHFCGLVGHALRTERCLTDRELQAGRFLATDGWCDA